MDCVPIKPVPSSTERGSGEWLPLRENIADQLEETYKGGVWNPKFKHVAPQPQGINAARIELMTTSSKGLCALFAGPEEAYLCTDDGLGWLRKLGGSTVAKLRRGYEAPTTPAALAAEADVKAEEGDQMAATTPVAGLVLFVHGIGVLGCCVYAVEGSTIAVLSHAWIGNAALV